MSSQVLQSIQNSKYWDEQLNYLSQLPLTQQTVNLLNNQKNSLIIKQLLSNSRSKVISSTCQFLVELLDKNGSTLHTFVNLIIGTEVLWKLLNSSNKIIYMNVNQLLKSMIMHCGNVKFWGHLAEQIKSKNVQVREAVSTYMLVLADMIQIPNNYEQIIRSCKNDASKKVRQNMCKLQQYVKQNKYQNKSIKNCTKQSNKQNIPDLVQMVVKPKKQQKASYLVGFKPNEFYSQQQIIMDSFLNNSSFVHQDNISQFNSRCEAELNSTSINYQTKEDLYDNIQFLLEKIQSHEQTWNMKLYAIQEIVQIFLSKYTEIQTKISHKIMVVFVKLLEQKRGRVNILIGNTLKMVVQSSMPCFTKFVENNFAYFVQQSSKNQQFGMYLISVIVKHQPEKYILQLVQCTVDIKPLKQKIMLLDLLVQKICQYQFPSSKISNIMKLLSKHIQKHYHNKQIYLPCLAIMSHIKSLHPTQFLHCLLCQDKQILNKVLAIAEAVDPHLREAIVLYIHTLKGTADKQRKQRKQSHSHLEYETITTQSQLQFLLNQIINNNQQGSVTKLVQYVFSNKQKITTHQYLQIIKLTQKVVQKNSLIQLQLLLQQICKTQNQYFLQALFKSISSCDAGSIQIQYIKAYLNKVFIMLTSYTWMMSPKHVQKLINIYRLSKCPKNRLLCIKILAHFPCEMTIPHVSTKEKLLIQSQQKLENSNITQRKN